MSAATQAKRDQLRESSARLGRAMVRISSSVYLELLGPVRVGHAHVLFASFE